jgi:hypothetical protein
MESLGKPTWTSLVVDLGGFGCNRGGGLRRFPNSDEVCWTGRCGEVGSDVWTCGVERMGDVP